jgi:hypothetical protein
MWRNYKAVSYLENCLGRSYKELRKILVEESLSEEDRNIFPVAVVSRK